MGEEGAASEVAEMVENGTVSSDKAANDVNGKKEAVEDVKDNEEAEGNKANDEPEGEPMEVDGKKDANEETDNKNNNNIEADDSKEEEEIPKEKGSKKGAKKKGGEEKSKSTKKVKEQTTPVAPTIERPVRARKSVERLVAVIENDATKEFHILKGRGTVLKDIPNVSYKLSKKKVVDDTLKLLHTILFGRRGKAALVKSNILQFSGFVWPENEEKHKLKVKEKLDKLNKEKLLEFCDIFGMTVSGANKEDIVVKLIDFMLTPHATTSELLAEKEQSTKGKKRKSESKKSTSSPEATPSKGSSKKTKSLSEEDKKRAAKTNDSEEESDEDEKDDEEHEDVNGATEKSEDEKSGDIAGEDVSEPEPESESESEPEEESSKKRKRSSTKSKSSKKESGVKPKEKKEVATPQKKKPVKSFISGSKVADQTDSGTKTFSRKNKRDAVKEKNGKRTVKEKEKPKSEKQKISDGDLRTAICEIFKEVDFNTATFTDIVKLLAKRFDTDLTSRKASIKFMIQEELTKIADEAEDDEDEEEAAGKEASGQEVKA
ncbi:DEK domain-containing chromatin-associated protein 3-like isoform X2 [Bidens hawaiensis]|uniref:DEK domain-containing chromatin-associated protein 3-like isoform X2 n=1 Tax=Bidens hawaiensis TaxID=980011 RepID=UPI00404B37BD